MHTSPLESINAALGAQINVARKEQCLTLSQLAGKCDLSQSFVSRLEPGQASASIANLLQICLALEIEFARLFSELEKPQRKTRLLVHRQPMAELSLIEATGYRWRHLGGGNLQDIMEVFYLVFPQHDRMESLVAHQGQEHCYVISGEVLFEVADESHRLHAGDGIFIDSEQPHRARSCGKNEAHVLMTVGTSIGTQQNFDWWRPVNTATTTVKPSL